MLEIIGDNTVRTSLQPKSKVVYCRGTPTRYWVEFQFVDENGEPLSGLNIHSSSDATRSGYTPEAQVSGETDKEGVVRFEEVTPCDIELFADAQQLVDMMSTRTLAVKRNPNSQPVNKSPFHRSIHDKNWRSDIQVKSEEQGFGYRYAVVGELCDKAPTIENWTDKTPPLFHFPFGNTFKGLFISGYELNRRYVIEVCPFRAWVLALDNTQDYSLANALNLGIMADLAYSAEEQNKTIAYFFNTKCQDLSVIPQFAEYPTFCHTLAVDVPFNDRYLEPVYLNTSYSDVPKGDTRLFRVECRKHLIVSWCGTDSLLNALTDIAYGPKSCPENLTTAGNIHGGFLQAYKLAMDRYEDKFISIEDSLTTSDKQLFVCGHSLGGALALVYSATMKQFNPILYTYGMPRTFTRAAIQELSTITHYRHVNDNDTVTQVPPDADLDSTFYRVWGKLGDKLGFDWTVSTLAGLGVSSRQLLMQSLGLSEKKDPYWHHGNTVIFFQAQQSVMRYRSQNMPWIGGGGQQNPAPGVIGYTNYYSVKLYLAPSLNEECLKASGEHQQKFIQCLDAPGMQKAFPQNTNPSLDGGLSNPMSHSMAHKYLPFIHNQILELADPTRQMGRKENREKFQLHVEKAATSTRGNEDEIARNREFIKLQSMLPVALTSIRSELTGKNALSRFAAVTEEEVELSR